VLELDALEGTRELLELSSELERGMEDGAMLEGWLERELLAIEVPTELVDCELR